MKRKIVSMLLCIAVCMTMMPTMAWAAGTTCGWTVAGVPVTSDNAGNITGTGISGSVTYDVGTNTLTLEDATINNTSGINIVCVDYNTKAPTIVVKGNNNVVNGSGNVIRNNGSELTIRSDGTGILNVESTTSGNGISSKAGMRFDNVTVTAKATSSQAIYCENGNVAIVKSKVTATTEKAGYDGIKLNSGVITAEGAVTSNTSFKSGVSKTFTGTIDNKFDFYNLWVGGVQVTSKNAGDITGTGISTTDGGKVSYDVDTNTLTLDNATITGSYSHTESNISAAVMSLVKENDTFKELNINLIGKNMITNPATSTSAETADYGILSYGNIRITKDGSAKDTPGVNCTSNGIAIYSDNNIIIENTDVTATSRQSDGIYAGANIEVKCSDVTATGGAGAYAIRSKNEPKYSSDIVIEEGKAATVGTESNTFHVIQATSDGGTVKIRKTDYTLYYNAADGKLYKSYHADAAEPKFADEYIGKGTTWTGSKSTESGKYDTLTLHSGFAFLTTAPTALKIIGMDANETFTIKGDNGGSKVNIAADINNKNTGNAIGIETNASLIVKDIWLHFINGSSSATNTITASGSIKVIDAQVWTGKIQTGGMLKLENAFVTAEKGGVFTINGIEYCGMLNLSGYSSTNATTIGDSDEIATMNGNITLDNLFDVIFVSMEGTWGDEKYIDGTWEGAGEYISKRSGWNEPRKISKPRAPSREGYTFTGWYCTDTSSSSTGVTKKISDGDWVTYEEAFSTASPKKLTSEAAKEIVNRDLSLWLRADWEKDGTSHTHNWSTDWTSDENCHWHECTADGCDITDNSQKDGYAAHNNNCTSQEPCSTCGANPTAYNAHNWSAWTHNVSTHTHKCLNPGCGANETNNCVSDGNATCQAFAKCTICGGNLGTKDSGKHVNSGVWEHSSTKHWLYYSCCDKMEAEADHVYDNDEDTICNTCGYDRSGAFVTYTITFNAGAGTASVDSARTNADGKLAQLPTATRSGYTFDGWYTSESGGTQITAAYTFSADATVYAHWVYSGSGSGGGSASGGSTAAPVQKPEIQPVSGGKTSLSKDGSTLTITPDEGMEIGTVTVNGKEVTVKDGKLTGLKTGDKVQVTFKAKTPTKEEQDQKVVKTVKNLKLTVRTTRTSERNVRTYVKADRKLNATAAELKAAGYTVQYKFYRSAKKASDYQLMLTKNTKNYVNTMGSKDTCYYYKVRLAVYDADGRFIMQTDLAQCRYGSRVWK